MSEWKTYKLGEISEIVARGISPKYSETGVPVINQKCVRDGKIVFNDIKFNNTNIKKISDEKFLRKNDILVNSTGQGTLGRVGQINFEIKKHTYDSHVTLVRINSNFDQVFVGYKLKSLQAYIESMAEGSTGQTELNREKLKQLEIQAPSLATQTQIAQILTSLDNKIELNLQMNQTLEAMAQAIFKEWFVDFKFPGFDGELENGLPKGWRMGKLGEEFNLTMGQSPKGETYNNNGNGMVFYQGRTDFGFRFPTNRLFTTEPNRKANFLDTLVSVRAPVGDINMANEECCIGRGLSAIRHKSDAFSYTYYSMKNLEHIFRGFESEGTVFGSINKANFENIEIIIPLGNIISEFEKVCNPIDLKILENSIQIQTLTQTRDTLLPKLMSGKISLNCD